MKRLTVFILSILLTKFSLAQTPPFFSSNLNHTPEYADVIKYYKSLAKENSIVSIELISNLLGATLINLTLDASKIGSSGNVFRTSSFSIK